MSNSVWYAFHTYTNNEKVDSSIEKPIKEIAYIKDNWDKAHVVSNNGYYKLNAKETVFIQKLNYRKASALISPMYS